MNTIVMNQGRVAFVACGAHSIVRAICTRIELLMFLDELLRNRMEEAIPTTLVERTSHSPPTALLAGGDQAEELKT